MIELTADMESIVKQAMLSFVATILVSVLQRPACRFFARATDKFVEEGIRGVSVSVGDREKSEAPVDNHQHGFPVAYGGDARAVSAITGAVVNDNLVRLQATGFGLNPERVSAANPRRPLAQTASLTLFQHRTLNPESTCPRTIRRLRRRSRAFPRRT